MRLRYMSAEVNEVKHITLETANGEIVELEDALVLTSYSSRVAVYCKMRVYLLPRFDYSMTTWRHLHAFIQDYCSFVRDYSAAEMRRVAKDELNNGEYVFAKAILTKRYGTDSYIDCYRDFY